MKNLLSTDKKPGLLAWAGYGLLVIVALSIITSIVGSFLPESSSSGEGGTASIMARYDTATFAPMPNAVAEMAVPSAQKSAGSAAVDAGTSVDVARVIKTGSLELMVEDVAKTMAQITTLATAKNGFVESSSIQDPGTGSRTAWVSVRVPVKVFESSLTEFKKLATVVLNESTQGQDVTMEYIDLAANIKNSKAEEESYINLMKKTGSVEEILSVTRQLAEVRGRIERLEAQKRYLENRTDMSTISIQLTEETRVNVPSRTWQPLEVLRQSVRDLVSSLQGLVDFMITFVIAVIGLLIPIVIFIGLIIWLGWKVLKFAMKKIRR
jgi:hypothetical protein